MMRRLEEWKTFQIIKQNPEIRTQIEIREEIGDKKTQRTKQ